MSARFIPKEDIAACERWELGAIGEAAVRFDPNVRLPTAGEVQELQEQAVREGYAAGVAQVETQAARLAALLQGFAAERTRFEDLVAEDVIALALDIAGQIVRTALKVHPELVLSVVRESIRLLPSAQGDALLILNPLDAAIVETQLAEELHSGGWRVVADASVAAGGCRIETGAGEVDATLGKRWQRVIATLGVEHEWLE